jgi:hypothetical protein
MTMSATDVVTLASFAAAVLEEEEAFTFFPAPPLGFGALRALTLVGIVNSTTPRPKRNLLANHGNKFLATRTTTLRIWCVYRRIAVDASTPPGKDATSPPAIDATKPLMAVWFFDC